MSARKDIVFLFNLLQDVNILRGLVQLAAAECEADLHLLVSNAFGKRDRLNIWGPELAELARETGAQVQVFETPADIRHYLNGRGGVMIAASESNLQAHAETRDAFRIAPASFIRITLQHGLECIGFLQSREHVLGHGRNITFNADLICAWLQADRLSALSYPERGKLQVTGPSTLLNRPLPHPDHPPAGGGLVCENMHSVRLSASGDHRASFMDIFFDFCHRLEARGQDVTLRPHPGGQYVLKNKIALPDNIHLNTLPIYHVDLAGYAYGISAPSTIVLDMVLADIPTAVWRDPAGIMDARNYDGLTTISSIEDWLGFERDARLRPGMILERQRRFLDRLGMPQDRAWIRARFAGLLQTALAAGSNAPPPRPVLCPRPRGDTFGYRLLVLGEETAPPLAIPGETETVLLSSSRMCGPGGVERAHGDIRAWQQRKIAEYAPRLVVVRTADAGLDAPLEQARGQGAVILFCRPDQPEGTRDLARLVRPGDLVHVGTGQDGEDLRRRGVGGQIVTGPLTAAVARALGQSAARAEALP